ncbi:WD40 repeat domain-containing protein [Dictyobacter kobayashii]|uniref:Uncharacterized protein n=1 Tax=Dictyobacter kobayashii TaxID=2014872 RepID=A0A402AUV6_9CHLR|nr:hypothetical protein [Dictyobacter kobayashii]GCE22855.1 hypothetical protein KDK_66550 [Dictyobacter kobayashii]
MQIIDIPTDKQLASYPVNNGVSALAWSPNGVYLATSNGDIFHALTGKIFTSYKGSIKKPITTIWSPDSKLIASYEGSHYLSKYVTDPNFVDTGKDATIHVWDITTGQDIFVYQGHQRPVSFAAWSPDGTKIASASLDTTVQIWQAAR